MAAWSEAVSIDTYEPADADDYPAFLDARVYQGSSGTVYPLPFHERISNTKRPHDWQAVHLENRWVRLMILPELGGRIHIGLDKTTGYDFFYRNNVIKPALVGLAGPWISGGVEFNWPQHHRPGTFLPTDVEIEHEADGSVTVWCSDHDPLSRMKGMHGIRLRPDSSVIEARVRLYNRTAERQTFLWWANVAAAVNDDYQSFFPTDVHHVADHAKRAVVSFPRVEGRYYGIDYPSRVDAEHPDADRLDWYRNIPVPTSYMVMRTEGEFFGGYDHGRQAGFVHVADRHVAPGKKQWTWGDAPFGWAWDRNLTDGDGPYVELMAGVFTDNQPDFAYLAPGETKTFSQYWFPIQQIGPAHIADVRLAARLDLVDGDVVVGIAPAVTDDEVRIRVDALSGTLLDEVHRLDPATPLFLSVTAPTAVTLTDLRLTVTSSGRAPLTFRHPPSGEVGEEPASAVEPPAPSDIDSIDELIHVGGYLAQYRHATRAPEPYWEEALRRDPGESRALTAVAWGDRSRGRADSATQRFAGAVDRQTRWVPTPATGEALYGLGLVREQAGDLEVAAEHYGRAAWDDAYADPATYALARIDARRGDRTRAIERLDRVILRSPDHLQARDLRAALTRDVDPDAAVSRAIDTLALDPLDQWARFLAGRTLTSDARTLLDIALESAAAGLSGDALALLDAAEVAAPRRAIGDVQILPLVAYHRARVLDALGRGDEAAAERRRARTLDARLTFPSGLDDLAALETAVAADRADALAWLLLGHWYYDAGRHADAVDAWQHSLENGPDRRTSVVAHRNLGIAAYNVRHDRALAAEHYASARALAPDDAKLLSEADQLAARNGVASDRRLAVLEGALDLVSERDDLTVTYARLLVEAGRAQEAKHLMRGRPFQPWEGGEGLVLSAWEAAGVAIAADLAADDATAAVDALRDALEPPESLGEARHPLVNDSGLRLALGDALEAVGRSEAARAEWRAAAESTGDFTNMSTQPYSTQTANSVLALQRLGDDAGSRALLRDMRAWVDDVARTPAAIDYFATSLPTMLLFVDDPQTEREREVATLRSLIAELDAALDSSPTVDDAHGPSGSGRDEMEQK